MECKVQQKVENIFSILLIDIKKQNALLELFLTDKGSFINSVLKGNEDGMKLFKILTPGYRAGKTIIWIMKYCRNTNSHGFCMVLFLYEWFTQHKIFEKVL